MSEVLTGKRRRVKIVRVKPHPFPANLIAACTLLALLAPPVRAVVALTAETSCPSFSTFRLGEPVRLNFTASGLPPNSNTTLSLTTTDEHDSVIDRRAIPVRADSSGAWSGSVEASSEALGFYRVHVALADGATIPASYTRPAGWITYAIVPDPAQRKDYGQAKSLFGLQGAFGVSSFKALPYLGARWALGSYPWFWKEHERPGQFHAGDPPNGVDAALKSFAAWNVYRIYCVNGVPPWAGKPATRAAGAQTAELNADGEKAYAAYCTQAAKDVVSRYPDEPRRYYQPLWEPVSPWGYLGTDEGLAKISQIAYQAIHAVDGKAVVIGPCGSSLDFQQLQWNDRLLRAGIAGQIDAFSLHPYVAYPSESHGYVSNVRALKALVRRDTGRALPIYGTEQGITTQENPAKELDQARGIVRDNLISLGEGFAVNYSFYFSDYRSGAEKGYGFYYNLDPKQNWGSDHVEPRPVVPAYAAMTLLIDGHDSTGPVSLAAGDALGYAFQRGADIVAALWDPAHDNTPIDLPAGADRVSVYDWMGRERSVDAVHGIVHLALGPEPIYVRGLSPALYGGMSERSVQVLTSDVDQTAGQSAMIEGKVRLPTGARAAAYTLRLAWPGLAAGRTVDFAHRSGAFRAAAPIPAGAAPGPYVVNLTLLHNGDIAGVGSATIEVKPLIGISGVAQAGADGAPAVAFDLISRSDRDQTVHVRVSSAGQHATLPEVSVDLPAHASKHLALPARPLAVDPAKPRRVTVDVRAGDGAVSTASADVDFLAAAQVATQPAAAQPGEAAPDWPGSTVVALDAPADIIRGPRNVAGEFGATIRCAWDRDNLYVACDVDAATRLQPFDDDRIWRGDSIQLAVNLTPGDIASTGNVAADLGSLIYTETNLALTDSGPVCYRSVTCDPVRLPLGKVAEPDIRLSAVAFSGRTAYYAAIPWKTLGARSAPAAGSTIGIAVAVNKIFTPAQTEPTGLGLYDGIAHEKDPSKFGTLLLAP